jgi:hypothetical protein
MSNHMSRVARLVAFPVILSFLAGLSGCIVETRPRHRYRSHTYRECHRNNGPYRRTVCTTHHR